MSNNECDTIVEINIPVTPSIQVILQEGNAQCSANGGFIFTQVFGGVEPYEYLWQDMSQDSFRQNLVDGFYELTITDANGCTSFSSVEIVNNVTLNFDIDILDVSCFNEADGLIDISILSGTPPYKIEWQDGETDLMREDLPPGEYSATISDANDCRIIINRTISEPDMLFLEFQINDASEFEVLVSGGTPPFTYLWNDGTTESKIEEPILGFAYEVIVTDANNCISVGEEIFAQVSTTSIDRQDVQVYPNPSRGDFNLSFAETLTLERIHIYSIHGQLLETNELNITAWQANLSLDGVPSGTYILEAIFQEGIYRQKILLLSD